MDRVIMRYFWAAATLALALVAFWRSVVYIDPNSRYPMFGSLMCGLWGVCLLITALAILINTPTPDHPSGDEA